MHTRTALAISGTSQQALRHKCFIRSAPDPSLCANFGRVSPSCFFLLLLSLFPFLLPRFLSSTRSFSRFHFTTWFDLFLRESSCSVDQIWWKWRGAHGERQGGRERPKRTEQSEERWQRERGREGGEEELRMEDCRKVEGGEGTEGNRERLRKKYERQGISLSVWCVSVLVCVCVRGYGALNVCSSGLILQDRTIKD